MYIQNNLKKIKSQLPVDVTLVAVSKTKPLSDLMQAYDAGQRVFGENYVQELVEKHKQMPKDVNWHFIGHLQSRKVKLIAPFIDLIHGVDSLKLLTEINKQAKTHNRIINCLLQVYIANEETKFGLNEEELDRLLNYVKTNNNDYQNIQIVGLMGMASFTSDQNQIEEEFIYLKTLFDKFQSHNHNLKILSMGMSGDYKMAIACGSNMVRIGSSIFGSR